MDDKKKYVPARKETHRVIRECEDCHDELMDIQRRSRCKNCGKLVCSWCFGHAHALNIVNKVCVAKQTEAVVNA
jgi:hypothetical protein